MALDRVKSIKSLLGVKGLREIVFKGQTYASFKVYPSWDFFCHLAHEYNFWNRSIFLKKHQILSRSLKESLESKFAKNTTEKRNF